MFVTNALDSVLNRYVNFSASPATNGTLMDADDRNIEMDELVNAVEASGQTLDPTGVIRDQLAIAIAKYGARAMVNYKGTTTRAIRKAFNISSVSWTSLGLYHVNFTNDFPDDEYIIAHNVCVDNSGSGSQFDGLNAFNKTVSGFDIQTFSGSNVEADAEIIDLVIFTV